MNLSKEQNYFLQQFKDFCIRGLSEDVIDTKIGEQKAKDMLIDGVTIVDMKPTMFIKAKGI
eukprot:2777477-Ditylum_brightwellii.AAC.1